MINGIILVNKPDGFTSFDVIAVMRGILGQKKLGHSGTLDPMATGVLPVFAGGATKAVSILPKTGKSYTAGFKLGIITDTCDITGRIIEQKDFDARRQELEASLEQFRGVIRQRPPVYSAVKVGGRRLYDLARSGKAEDVEIPEREVEVTRLVLTEFNEKTGFGVLEMDCSQGTYVRSVIRDMGEALGCGATMTSLERTYSNGFSVDDCVTLGELERLRDENRLESVVRPVEEMFTALPRLVLSENQTVHYKNGVKQSLSQFNVPEDAELMRIYGSEREFIGIGRADRAEGVLRVYKNLGGDGA